MPVNQARLQLLVQSFGGCQTARLLKRSTSRNRAKQLGMTKPLKKYFARSRSA